MNQLILPLKSIFLATTGINKKVLKSFLFYLLSCLILLGLISILIISNEDTFKIWFLNYIFPKSWQLPIEIVIKFLLKSITRDILINGIVTFTFMIVSILLFPIKEKLSATYEVENELIDDPIKELPLFMQGLEEVKLLLVYLTAQMMIFWIGYQSAWMLKKLALVLSYVFLFTTFSTDFIAPVLQRHGRYYSQIVKTLLKNPLLTLFFGALLAVPSLVVTHLIVDVWDWKLAYAVIGIFSFSIIFIVLSVLAGTRMGALIFNQTDLIKRPNKAYQLIGWPALLLLFSLNCVVFARLGASFHHKSQFLKLKYTYVHNSFDLASFNLRSIFQGKLGGSIKFIIEIENPTEFNFEIEKNRLTLEHNNNIIASSSISPMVIKSKSVKLVPIEVESKMNLSSLKFNKDLLKSWSIVLYFKIMENFEFPLRILN